MSYTKVNWNSGDVITQEKLDQMDQGIADASPTILVAVRGENNSFSLHLTKTFSELEALVIGTEGSESYTPVYVVIKYGENNDYRMGMISRIIKDAGNSHYDIIVSYNSTTDYTFRASSVDGIPHCTING